MHIISRPCFMRASSLLRSAQVRRFPYELALASSSSLTRGYHHASQPMIPNAYTNHHNVHLKQIRMLSQFPPPPEPPKDKPPKIFKLQGEMKEDSVDPITRFKIAAKHYGPMFVVVHIAVSLISLGICYCIVIFGVDITKIIPHFFSPKLDTDTFMRIPPKWAEYAAEGSYFLIAYGIHKLLMPVRLTISLGATGLLVKFLRAKGIMKGAPPPLRRKW